MRNAQGDGSQMWFLQPRGTPGSGEYRLKHVKSGRYLDAWGQQFVGTKDAQKVNFVRTKEDEDNDDTQRFRLRKVGDPPPIEGVYTVQQKLSGRYLDAHFVDRSGMTIPGQPAGAPGMLATPPQVVDFPGFEAVLRPRS